MRIPKGLIAFILLSVSLVSGTAYGAFPYTRTHTVSAGDTILPDHVNDSNSDHINNNIPESIDDFSATASEMQSKRDPFPGSVISLSTTLDDELEAIRNQLHDIIGKQFWYQDVGTYATSTADFDHGTFTYTTGGQIVLDVDGSGTNTAGSINFGVDKDAGFYFDGSDLIGTSTGDIKYSARGNDHIFSGGTATTTVATIDDTGIDIASGDEYSINAASVLSATALGAAVVDSSLTGVGTLGSLTANGTVDFGGSGVVETTDLTGQGVIDFGTATSFELPSDAAPTVDAQGEIALDTTITGYHQGLLTHYGTETNYVISIPTNQLSTTEGDVIIYDAALDEFKMGTVTTGAGTPGFSDAADPVVQTTTGSDVHVGDGAGTLVGKLEIGGDADQPQVVIEGFSTQTDDIFIIQNDADSEQFTVSNTGTATANAISVSDGNITNVADIALDTISSDASGTITANNDLSLADNILLRPEMQDYSETLTSIDNADGATNLNLEHGNNFWVKLDEDVTITVINPPASGKMASFTVVFEQSNLGTSTVAWTNFKWDDGTAPTIGTGLGTVTAVVAFGTDTTNWFGFNAGDDLR